MMILKGISQASLRLVSAFALLLSVKVACLHGASASTNKIGPSLLCDGKSCDVYYYNVSATFCEAVQLCHDAGQEMIDNSAFQAMKGTFPVLGLANWWIGLVDALNERNRSRDNWVWIKDGSPITKAVGDSIFGNNEPDAGFGEDCVATQGSLVWDEKCNAKYFNVLCYGLTDDYSQVVRRPSSAVFAKVPIYIYAQPDDGCWINASSTVTNVLACSAACYDVPNSDCIGFYWNSARQRCIIVPYFDAAVPLEARNAWERLQWKKFRRI